MSTRREDVVEVTFDRSPDNPLGLPAFDGCPVVQISAEIANVGGGLNRSIDLDQRVQLDMATTVIGDTRYMLLRVDKIESAFKPVKDDEGNLRRVDKYRCTDATLVADEWAEEAIHKQMETNRIESERRKLEAEERAGVQRLKDKDGNPVGAK